MAALLIRRLLARGPPLDSLGGIGRLLAAIAAGTAISATVGPLSLLAGDVISASELPGVARTWWLGDAAGALVVIPLALAWYRPPPRGWTHGRAVEAVLMLAAVAGDERDRVPQRDARWPISSSRPWAGPRCASAAAAPRSRSPSRSASRSGTPRTITGRSCSTRSRSACSIPSSTSPWRRWRRCASPRSSSERRRFAERLDASRARLVEASDTERRRLEHNLHDGAQQRLTGLDDPAGARRQLAREAHEPGAEALDNARRRGGRSRSRSYASSRAASIPRS